MVRHISNVLWAEKKIHYKKCKTFRVHNNKNESLAEVRVSFQQETILFANSELKKENCTIKSKHRINPTQQFLTSYPVKVRAFVTSKLLCNVWSRSLAAPSHEGSLQSCSAVWRSVAKSLNPPWNKQNTFGGYLRADAATVPRICESVNLSIFGSWSGTLLSLWEIDIFEERMWNKIRKTLSL